MATTYYQNTKDAGLDIIMKFVKSEKGFVTGEKKIMEDLAEKVTYKGNVAKLTGVIPVRVEKVLNMGYEVYLNGKTDNNNLIRIFCNYDMKFFKSNLEKIIKKAYKDIK